MILISGPEATAASGSRFCTNIPPGRISHSIGSAASSALPVKTLFEFGRFILFNAGCNLLRPVTAKRSPKTPPLLPNHQNTTPRTVSPLQKTESAHCNPLQRSNIITSQEITLLPQTAAKTVSPSPKGRFDSFLAPTTPREHRYEEERARNPRTWLRLEKMELQHEKIAICEGTLVVLEGPPGRTGAETLNPLPCSAGLGDRINQFTDLCQDLAFSFKF